MVAIWLSKTISILCVETLKFEKQKLNIQQAWLNLERNIVKPPNWGYILVILIQPVKNYTGRW